MNTKYIRNIISLMIIIFIIFIIKYISVKTNKKAMVIVEPRPHKLLKAVIENFDKTMGPEWELYVFHGKSHSKFAKEAIKNIKLRKIHLNPLDTDNLTANGYNSLFKKRSFWDKVDAENILVFQTDTVTCGNSLNKIDDFLKYSYVGCPFDDKIVGNHHIWGNYPFYGIGGLSIRKKSFMVDCINRHPNIDDNYAEDVFFSMCVKDIGNPENINIDTLNNFCTQHKYTKNSFGAHKVNIDLPMNQRKKFYSFCPSAKILS